MKIVNIMKILNYSWIFLFKDNVMKILLIIIVNLKIGEVSLY